MYKGEIRSPVIVLLLSLVTCGIYYYYWVYKTPEEVQAYTGTSTTTPAVELLLTIFTCGFYGIYWFYKYSKLLLECQQKAGIREEDISLICMLLPILGLGIVSMMIFQSNLNMVWEAA